MVKVICIKDCKCIKQGILTDNLHSIFNGINLEGMCYKGKVYSVFSINEAHILISESIDGELPIVYKADKKNFISIAEIREENIKRILDV